MLASEKIEKIVAFQDLYEDNWMFSVGDMGGLKGGAGVEDDDQNLLVEKCAQSSLGSALLAT